MKTIAAIALYALLAAPAFAQHDPDSHAASPYAGFQQREIRALSEAQLADLRAGRGMSLALPAELNGYPGPRHVLDLAAPLALTAEQRARTQALFDEMERGAKALGARLIDSERALEALFAKKTITPASLSQAVADAARVQGELRAHHLKYHLTVAELLTPAQVARYNELRGYARLDFR